MFPVGQLLVSALAAAIPFSLWKILRIMWYHPLYKSPLRHLRGPKGSSWIFGNFSDISKDGTGAIFETWVEEYGDTMRFKGFLSKNQLLTVDSRAVHHILTHPDIYQKSPMTRRAMEQIFGKGLLVAEGTRHRQQRRAMNPAFGPAQVREFMEFFFQKSILLRDLWSSEISKDLAATITGTRIDVVPWLNKLTLDIIGRAGFGYDFNALEPSGQLNELSEAFSAMVGAAEGITLFDALRAGFPLLQLIPNAKARKLEAAQRTMTRVGKELLTNAKAAALASATENGEIEKNTLRGRDLLSLLLKANMATDLPESQKLPDEDAIAQVPTFLVAGHETTSTAITWALYVLTQSPEVQRKLRDELLAVDTDTPSMDELMALPYLDAVLKETLRMYPPIRIMPRFATQDNVIPVKKSYTDRYGVIRDTIPIAKGEPITLPIQAINRSKELWGPDADQFKPERWNDVPEAVSQIPGVWAHMLTFLGGPRACIGYRFAVAESKAILFSLVRAFEFELAVPASQVGIKMFITQRPVLQNDPTHQAQLPLLIRPYRTA